jgi:single-stranded-DNA-specific exonuclease
MQLRRRVPRVAEGGAVPGLHPLIDRLYRHRGVRPDEAADTRLARLLPPEFRGINQAATLIAAAIGNQQRIVVAGDYDCDGATGVAVAVRGLRLLGARHVAFVVPDRFRMGYGLSPALVDLAAAKQADLIVTVDSGISSLDGVAHAAAQGIPVVVTDHHLPGAVLPAAAAIVNPNQPDCPFGSPHLAGVGVMFYVLAAVRRLLIDAGHDCPPLAPLLDLVALGTVADVVRLDANNRVLVEAGLRRIRARQCAPGILALLEVAGRAPETVQASDLGFVLGPRINAAGRLDNISLGIECLITDDPAEAERCARALDETNRARREIEADMRDVAVALSDDDDRVGLCLFDPDWHEGVVGLVASRIKERRHRPVIAAARAAAPGQLKASGRTIAGLHLRDALADVDARHPGLIDRFGGHAMAAGLTLPEVNWLQFCDAFDAVCRARLDATMLTAMLESDGPLPDEWLTLEVAEQIEQAGPWGQGFSEPTFDGEFRISSVRRMGAAQQHARYTAETATGMPVTLVHFGADDGLLTAGDRCHLAYRLSVNRWQGATRLDLMVQATIS